MTERFEICQLPFHIKREHTKVLTRRSFSWLLRLSFYSFSLKPNENCCLKVQFQSSKLAREPVVSHIFVLYNFTRSLETRELLVKNNLCHALCDFNVYKLHVTLIAASWKYHNGLKIGVFIVMTRYSYTQFLSWGLQIEINI